VTIQAIETRYAGCRFRSRLEARWAVFFDYAGIRWEYEPQGYRLSDGTTYLPDFLLTDPSWYGFGKYHKNRRPWWLPCSGGNPDELHALDYSEDPDQVIVDAYVAARSARFEHGERGR
jgi:hypothetical protein